MTIHPRAFILVQPAYRLPSFLSFFHLHLVDGPAVEAAVPYVGHAICTPSSNQEPPTRLPLQLP